MSKSGKKKMPRRVKIWGIAGGLLLVILLVATLVVTQIPYLRGLLDQVFGGAGNVIEYGEGTSYTDFEYYSTDKTSKEESLSAANALVEEICEEGTILLKNSNGALPLLTPETENDAYPKAAESPRVSIFGKNSVNLVLGGSGSSSTDHSRAMDIYDSLSAAGYVCNPMLKEFYESSSLSGAGRDGEASIEAAANFGVITGETPYEMYTENVISSYAEYNDMALIVISRTSGEGNDMPRTMRNSADEGSDAVSGAFSKDDHYLELDKNEQELIKNVCDAGFKRVVLILNTSTSIELGFLDGVDDGDVTSILDGYDTKIDAALIIGFPGDNGIMALGRILNGSVNPSGRTVDLYARDFTQDPTYYNFGHNNADKGNQYLIEGKREGRNGSGEYFVEYEEGIYYGYRYYETRAAELDLAEASKGEAWYTDHVVYPFGYGLSYTEFSWSVVAAQADGALDPDGTLSFDVTVTNTGSVAGKDVVQVYYTAPYYEGGIEKAYKVLAGFAKTDLIAPGASDTVTISFDVQDMASYDCYDANENGFAGYELDAGSYVISISRDSHTAVSTFSYSLGGTGIQYRENKLGNEVVNQFDDVSEHYVSENGDIKLMTRADFKNDEIDSFPTTPTKEERTVTQEFISAITHLYNTNDAADPWYVDESQMPAMGVVLDEPIMFFEMRLIPYGDEIITEEQSQRFAGQTGAEVWATFVSQLTVAEITNFIGTSSYSTPAIESIQKPGTIDSDGPLGWVNFMAYANDTISNVCSYQSEPVLAATYNVDLARRMGEAVGDEALVGYTSANGSSQSYTGWFAPGVNIHRSPFGGRNFEYYSEDPLLLGNMASSLIQGANSKGLYTQLKHFAANDQETNRSGICTWVDEQTLREIYLKPFEIAIIEGGSRGLMSSFNRIGTVWTGGSYALLTNVLRGEWDFTGMVISDYNTGPTYMDSNQMVLAGGDVNLATGVFPDTNNLTASLATALQRAAKNFLYVQANSNAMNGLGQGTAVSVTAQSWIIWLLWLDIAVLTAVIIWGVLAICSSKKKNRHSS